MKKIIALLLIVLAPMVLRAQTLFNVNQIAPSGLFTNGFTDFYQELEWIQDHSFFRTNGYDHVTFLTNLNGDVNFMHVTQEEKANIPAYVTASEEAFASFSNRVNLMTMKVPAIVESYENETNFLNGFQFITNGLTIVITNYIGTAGVITIPSTISGFPVTDIQAFAFYGDTHITDVTIPDSVTNISANNFSTCNNLMNVVVGAGVVSIGSLSFYADGNLERIYFKGDLPTSIGSLWTTIATSSSQDAIVEYELMRNGWNKSTLDTYSINSTIHPYTAERMMIGTTGTATGRGSFSTGNGIVTGNYSTALSGSKVIGNDSLAAAGGIVTGNNSVAIGPLAHAKGNSVFIWSDSDRTNKYTMSATISAINGVWLYGGQGVFWNDEILATVNQTTNLSYTAITNSPWVSTNDTGVKMGSDVTVSGTGFGQGIGISAGTYGFSQGAGVHGGDYSFSQGFNVAAGQRSFAVGEGITVTNNEFMWGYYPPNHGSNTATFGVSNIYAGPNRLVRIDELDSLLMGGGGGAGGIVTTNAAFTNLQNDVSVVETGKVDQAEFISVSNQVASLSTGKVSIAHTTDPAAHSNAIVQRISDAAPRVVFEANLSSPFYLADGLDYIYWDQVVADVYGGFYDGTDYVVPPELDGVTALITATFVPTSSGSSFTPLELRLMAASDTWYAYYYHSSHDGVIVPPISERQPTMTVSVVKKLTAGVHLWFEGESDSDGGSISSVDRWTITVLNPAPQGVNFRYSINDGVATVTDYIGTNTVATVPDTLYGAPVYYTGQFSSDCGVASLTFGDNYRSVGGAGDGGDFYSVLTLTNVVFGAGLTNIGERAFGQDENLRTFYFKGDAPTVNNSFETKPADATVYYVAGKTGFGNGWGGFTNFVVWTP